MAFADVLTRASIMNLETGKRMADMKLQNSYLQNQISQQRFDAEVAFQRQRAEERRARKEAEKKARRKRNITYAALAATAVVGGVAGLAAAGGPAAGAAPVLGSGVGIGGTTLGGLALPAGVATVAAPAGLGFGAQLGAFGAGAFGAINSPVNGLLQLGVN